MGFLTLFLQSFFCLKISLRTSIFTSTFTVSLFPNIFFEFDPTTAILFRFVTNPNTASFSHCPFFNFITTPFFSREAKTNHKRGLFVARKRCVTKRPQAGKTFTHTKRMCKEKIAFVFFSWYLNLGREGR